MKDGDEKQSFEIDFLASHTKLGSSIDNDLLMIFFLQIQEISFEAIT